MTSMQKVAYLKGLADGLGLDKDSKHDRLLAAIIDVLDAVAQDIDELEENAFDLGDEIDAISDDLADLESLVYEDYAEDDDYEEYDDEDSCCGDYDDACCCGGGEHHHDEHECCGGHHHEHHHHEHSCGCGCHDEEPIFYEVTCPACNNTITVDEDVILLKTIQCPNCGEMLEFDLDSIEYVEESPDKE